MAYFPDHTPVGYGPWHAVFLLPCPHASPPAAATRAAEYRRLWAALRVRGVRVTAVFALRGSDRSVAAPSGAVELAAAPGPEDRARLFLQVERDLLARIAGPLKREVERLHQALGSTVDARIRAIDAELAGGSPPAGGLPMDVVCHVSPRIVGPKWDIRDPAPQQLIR